MKMMHYFPLFVALSLLLISVLVFTSCSGSAETTTASSTAVTTPLITTVPAPVTTTPKVTTKVTPITTTLPETTTQAPETEAKPEWVNAVFGGGPFTTGKNPVAKQIANSRFNTLMIWSVHVQTNGDLKLNDILVVKDGALAPGFDAKTWELFKTSCPNITRIEISVGAWGTPDFENIRSLINRDGTGKDTILYRNFKALIEATGADAVNFDDESLHDVDSMSKFGKMCIDMGAKVTFCPYNNVTFWLQLRNAIGKEHVDRIYLQCYDGGAGNNPADWSRQFGMDVIPGYWCLKNGETADKGKKTPEEVTDHLEQYQNYATGGFMWLFDEMISHGTVNSYASAIEAAGAGKEWD